MTDRQLEASAALRHPGLSQDDRWIDALQPGYVDLDERSFEAMLSAAVDRARLIRFRDDNNRDAGDWSTFLTADETVILALIINCDLRRAERDLEAVLPSTVPGMPVDRQPGEFPTLALARKLDLWLTSLQSTGGGVGDRVRSVIEDWIDSRLRAELEGLLLFLDESDVWPSAARDGFGAFWHRGTTTPATLPPPDARARFLRDNFHTFRNAVRSLQELAATVMPESLTTGTHDPAAGLFLAFLRLFQRVQRDANRFTERHRAFYYDRVLGTSPKPATPDRAILTFATDGPDRSVLIPAGTRFTAGLDADNEYIVYTSDTDIDVTGASVADLRTLSFDRDGTVSPENELTRRGDERAGEEHRATLQPRGYVSGANTMALKSAIGPETDPNRAGGPWPLFGAASLGRHLSGRRAARFGFAVASPVLLLAEGRREICLTMQLDFGPGGSELDRVIEVLGLRDPEGPHQAFLFGRTFHDLFVLELTVPSGWQRISDYQVVGHAVDADVPQDRLLIRFELGPEADPVVGHDQVVHGDRFETDSPVLAVTINPDAYLYPYSLLVDGRISELTIDVSAAGIRDLVLANGLGPLDPTSPFNPFGPLPSLGSYLIVGSAEAARKHVRQFEVNVQWGDLPVTSRDFADHYDAYGQPFDRDDESRFRGRVSTLQDGRWEPADENRRPVVDLFRPDEGQASSSAWKTRRRQRWSFGDGVIRHFTPARSALTDEGLVYSTQADGGFFRIDLSQPDHAFGHQLYPLALTEALTANARSRLGRAPRPLPNPPYTPLIDAVSVDYSATAVFDMGGGAPATSPDRAECLFQLHPFGETTVRPGDEDLRIVPRYDSDGTLFIGVSAATKPEVLTLYFHLAEDCAPEAAVNDLGMRWHYLSADRWRSLHTPPLPTRVVADTTDGFLTSGIVTLHLPDDLTNDNSLMSSGLYWLRVSVDRWPHWLGRLHSVSAQAVGVTRDESGGSLGNERVRLDANSISEPEIPIPAVASVSQPAPSFGGVPAEGTARRLARVSERIRHRNRALRSTDYELLILEAFPEVHKVKCFSSVEASSANETAVVKPGHVSIVIVPDPARSPSLHAKPLHHGRLIDEIRSFVAERASPFVTVDARNAAYEEVQVRCTIRFAPGPSADTGLRLRELDRAINRYLSPWEPSVGYGPQFGWTIQARAVESYVRSLDGVDLVTNFSMLRLSADDDELEYRLDDTVSEARNLNPGSATRPYRSATEVPARYPWSIAVPFERHYIELATDDQGVVRPEPTRLGELQVGRTFIVDNVGGT